MNGTESIEKKLTRAFVKVAAITAAVAFVALLALIILSNRYSYAYSVWIEPSSIPS